MQTRTNIGNLCRTRLLELQQEAQNATREVSEAIERSTGPLSDMDAERPFMIPRYHDPFDIWQYILKHVTDPHEILTLWEVCPLFREILSIKGKYIQARLPQIAQIIKDKRPRLLLENKESFRFPRYLLWRLAVLNLRRTSRLCKNSVEGFTREFYIEFDNVRRVRSMVDRIRDEELLPDAFLFRNVQVGHFLQLLHPHELTPFSEAISVLLELVGECVMKLKYNSVNDPRQTYDNLRNMVIHTPNLKSLKLEGHFHFHNLDADVPAFPLCPQLRSFTQIERKLPQVCIQRIIEACPHIQTLKIEKELHDDHEEGFIDLSEMSVKMQNLERLHMTMFLRHLRPLVFRMPLKEIVFNFHYSCRGLKTSEVFAFVNQFQETLEHLEMGAWMGMEHSEKCFLDLPHLRVFHWRPYGFKDLGFLLNAERLEQVEMWFGQMTPNLESLPERILMGTSEVFDGHAIWEVFPRLKKFVIYVYRSGGVPEIVFQKDDVV